MTSSQNLQQPAAGVYYHYTTRASAQEMSMAGRILLGRAGLIYLTDVLYSIGWQATDRLALPERNAEVAIPISEADLPPPIQYLGVVPEWPAGSGRSFRRGGGHQWVVSQPIPLRIMPWSWLELEIP
jgi:hypothetical protein